MWHDFGIACLMRTRCRSKRGLLPFVIGTVLGITIGCTMTLSYVLHLNKLERTEFDRFPRMVQEPVMHLPLSDTAATVAKSTERAFNNTIATTTATVTKHQYNTTSREEDFLQESVNKISLIDGHLYQTKHQLYRWPYLVVVVATNTPTNRIETIYDTWGRDVSAIKFYTGASEQTTQLHTEGVPVVQLHDLGSSSEWTQISKILEHVYKNYFNEYNWFVLTLDDLYINGHGLQELLSRMDSETDVYIGHPMQFSWTNKPFTYCSSQLGIVLSRRLLYNLVTKIEQCKSFMSSWDAELGQCIKSLISIECGHNMDEVTNYFSLDVNGRIESMDNLLQDYSLLRGLTIAPIGRDEQMYMLHYLYKMKQLKNVNDKVSKLNEELRQICQNLPQVAFENDKVQDICVSLKVQEIQEDETDSVRPKAIALTTATNKFHPHNRFQVQAWNYFDAINIYEDESIMPRRSLKTYKYHSMELQKALQEAVKAASRQHHAKLRFKKIINGYVRHNPLQGNEYIIDAKFVEARNPRKRFHKRIRLLRPLSSSYIVQPSKSNSSETIHFIVPVTKVTGRFTDFLKMYEKLVLIPRERVHLVLSVYGDDDIRQVSQNTSIYFKKYPEAADITIVQGYGEFSRAKALDLGMSKLADNNLVFFCDVDMNIDRQFLTKCRRNTVQGHSVYYPEVFKLYNRKYVYRNSWHPRKYGISREQGHWGYYAYGMLCIYKSDYIAVGGLDVAMVGWGGEDVDLYERVLRSGLDVLRAPDASLIHRWHSKSCKMQSSSKMLEHCLMSQSEVLADRRELARYIFDTEGIDGDTTNF